MWGLFLRARWQILRARRAQEAPRRLFFARLREEARVMPRLRLVWYILFCLQVLASIVGTTVMLIQK